MSETLKDLNILRQYHELNIKAIYSEMKNNKTGSTAWQISNMPVEPVLRYIYQRKTLILRESSLPEAWAGIEPAHVGFADRSVTTSPPRHVAAKIVYTIYSSSAALTSLDISSIRRLTLSPASMTKSKKGR